MELSSLVVCAVSTCVLGNLPVGDKNLKQPKIQHLWNVDCEYLPQGFHFLLVFGHGEWAVVFSQPVVFQGVRVYAEAIAVLVLIVMVWLNAFLPNRCYYFSDGTRRRKWDPNHGILTSACLMSPVHAMLFIFSCLTRVDGGRSPWIPGICIASVHAYSSLLLVHIFLQREDIQKQIFSGVYATEVAFRENQSNLRRQAERQVFEKVGQSRHFQ